MEGGKEEEEEEEGEERRKRRERREGRGERGEMKVTTQTYVSACHSNQGHTRTVVVSASSLFWFTSFSFSVR